MTATHEQYITTLEQTLPILTHLTAGLSDDLLNARKTADEWSLREILAHLVDDEMFIMRARLARIIKEDNPSLVSHDEKHWHAQRNTSRDSLEALLGDFAVQRAASLNILTFLSGSDWLRPAYHPEYGHF